MSGLRGLNNQPASPPYTNGPYEWDAQLKLSEAPLRNAPGRVVLEEYFKQPPALNADIGVATNLNFEVLGTNMTSALVTFSETEAGITLTTAGADNDQSILLPHLDTKQTSWTQTKWGTENQVVWECQLRLAQITTSLVWAGLKLTNTPTIATDDDQVFFRFSTDDSDTNWEIAYSIGGVDVTVDSGVAVAAATDYNFRIEVNSSRIAIFYINDVEVARSTALTNDVDLIPYVGIQALDTAAVALTVSYEKISRIIFE